MSKFIGATFGSRYAYSKRSKAVTQLRTQLRRFLFQYIRDILRFFSTLLTLSCIIYLAAMNLSAGCCQCTALKTVMSPMVYYNHRYLRAYNKASPIYERGRRPNESLLNYKQNIFTSSDTARHDTTRHNHTQEITQETLTTFHLCVLRG